MNISKRQGASNPLMMRFGNTGRSRSRNPPKAPQVQPTASKISGMRISQAPKGSMHNSVAGSKIPSNSRVSYHNSMTHHNTQSEYPKILILPKPKEKHQKNFFGIF